jgi:3-dehydrosphinganine reductase
VLVVGAVVEVPAVHVVTTINDMKNFSQKTVLISGGSSGIGLALAKKLALKNANICILARDLSKLETAISEISKNRQSESQQFILLKADVSNRVELESVILEWMARSGTPDLVINSAGVAFPGEFTTLSPELFDWMMDINFHGTVNVTRIVLPSMIHRHSGHIVNISSLVGYLGMYGYSAYSASKFAVRGFTDSLRTEVKRLGIDLSIVFPPDTDTPQLAEENKHKPALLFAMDEAAPVVSADYVADAILAGVQKRQYLITPGLSSWLYFRLMGLLGPLVYPVVDFMLEDARRKVERDQTRYTHKHEINPDQTRDK